MREHGQKTDKLLHFGAMAFSDLASNLARALPKGWLRGVDLNHRPLGYEPNELPGCSTPHLHVMRSRNHSQGDAHGGAITVGRYRRCKEGPWRSNTAPRSYPASHGHCLTATAMDTWA